MFRSFVRCAGALVVAGSVHAQASDTLPRPNLQATVRATAIHIDGRLDEGIWSRAEVAADFVQREPVPDAPSAQRTEVRVLVDEGSLYVGARLFDTSPDSIARQLGRRDPDNVFSDFFHVAIDSYFDRRTAFRFSVTPVNVQADAFHYNNSNDDSNWDAVWESAATIDSMGWTAELRIPLSQLRFAGSATRAERRWGIQFGREIARYGEESYWSPNPPTQSGVVSRFGDLTGLDVVRAPARLEFLPYFSSQVTRLPDTESNPLIDGTRASARVGADVRYGLPGGLTLTATINPDFGQVEADAAVVNLSAFETFFDERRPFFLEGGDIFRFGSTVTMNDNEPPQPFYSRRIGRSPRGSVEEDDVEHVDEPTQTDILGAVKVSGKTPGGWSLGLLGAQTARERARFLRSDGSLGRATVEPRAEYFVGRLSRDLRGGNTVLGVAGTATRRQEDAAFDALLARDAVVGGTSFEHSWNERAWVLSGYTSASRVAGDREYITSLQRSNTHLLQRPDRTDRHVDSARTTLTGTYHALSLAKLGGTHWQGSLTWESTSPGFDVNDLGFQRRSDVRSLSSVVEYQETRPTWLTRSWEAGLSGTQSTNFNGDVIERRITGEARAEWRNFWELDFVANIQPSTLDDRLTRGGPLARRPLTYFVEASIDSDDRRPTTFNVEYSYDGSAEDEWGHAVEAEVSIRPNSAVEISLGAEYSREYNRDQFVTAPTDPTSSGMFGRRYVFGDIEQRELGMELRLQWILSPRLSLQTFLEPLVSSGRFARYKELRTPRSFEFDVYGEDLGTITRDEAAGIVEVDPDAGGPAASFQFRERDFTVRALLGNAVLRWEFRPGSTLFVVWQQQREEEDALADFSATRRPMEAFRVPAENVLLMKVAYWFGR